jgi:hypothetical protein
VKETGLLGWNLALTPLSGGVQADNLLSRE